MTVIYQVPESAKIYSRDGTCIGYFGPPNGGFNCYVCGTECECGYDFDTFYRED